MNQSLSVGVLGLGIIGSRIAECLYQSQFPTFVWNRTPKPDTLGWRNTATDVAQQSQVLQIFVRDGAALHEVLDAIEPNLTPDHIVLNHATVDLISTQRADDRLRQKGVKFLDCPFTGSRDAAGSGALCYYVGGDFATLEIVRPILEVSSAEILWVGKVGVATILKVATNLISATVNHSLAEALALIRALDIDPEMLVKAINVNANRSKLSDMKLPAMIAENYEPHFSVKNMSKDASIALDLADSVGLSLAAGREVAMTLAAATEIVPDEDFATISKFIKRSS